MSAIYPIIDTIGVEKGKSKIQAKLFLVLCCCGLTRIENVIETGTSERLISKLFYGGVWHTWAQHFGSRLNRSCNDSPKTQTKLLLVLCCYGRTKNANVISNRRNTGTYMLYISTTHSESAQWELKLPSKISSEVSACFFIFLPFSFLLSSSSLLIFLPFSPFFFTFSRLREKTRRAPCSFQWQKRGMRWWSKQLLLEISYEWRRWWLKVRWSMEVMGWSVPLSLMSDDA